MNGDNASIGVALAGRLGAFSLDAAFTAPMRGITAIFGPSGCGKTTVLRCMAGLTRLPGRLSIGGEIWQDDSVGLFRPPHKRPIGYVFQEASLFPHLSIRKNLLYGARRAGRAAGPQVNGAPDLDGIVELLGISSLLDRAPDALSGGERQRVAIGRALLSRPRLLLMDEPLAALDRQTKAEILPYLEMLHASLAIPILYVSHDIAEVERLADTLVLLSGGRVLAAGPLAELEADPALPLLRAPEAGVTLEGRISEIDHVYGLTSLSVAGGALIVPGQRDAPGTHRRLRIRASDVSFTRQRPSETTILNCLPAKVVSISPLEGNDAQVNVVAALGPDGAGAQIAGRITRKSRDALALAPGTPVFAQIKSVALIAARSGRESCEATFPDMPTATPAKGDVLS